METTKPRRNIVTIVLVVLTILVPASAMHFARVWAGPPEIDPFGMPWPEPFWHGLQYVAAAIIVLTVLLAVVGIIRKGSSRVAGFVALPVVAVFALLALWVNGLLNG